MSSGVVTRSSRQKPGDKSKETVSTSNIHRKVQVDCKDIIKCVGSVTIAHIERVEELLGLSLMTLHSCQDKATILNEKIPPEMDALLMETALSSIIGQMTIKVYPDVTVIKSCFNYILNDHHCQELGLCTLLFERLKTWHPPCRPGMGQYYTSLLKDHFVIINSKETEKKSLLWCLVDLCLACLQKEGTISAGDVDYWCPQPATDMAESVNELTKWLADNIIGSSLAKFKAHVNRPKQMYFKDFSTTDQLRRCLTSLKVVCDILEADFLGWYKTEWLKRRNIKDCTKPMICSQVWTDTRDTGMLNKKVEKLFRLQLKLGYLNTSHVSTVNKLVAMVTELSRCADTTEAIVYPCLGNNCESVARTLAVQVLEGLAKSAELESLVLLTRYLKPVWLRLLVCKHILNNLTGNQVLLELTAVSDIFEHVAAMKDELNQPSNSTKDRVKQEADATIVERLKKLKSVNSKLVTGVTRLHMACHKNNVGEVRALLTFSELDVNALDHSGWTGLHEACFRGSKECVEELLQFTPLLGDIQRPADTRARGQHAYTPLMCAAERSHAEICRLLLHHSGSVLLEDITEDNLTALDLASSEDVVAVLKHYKVNVHTTDRGRRKMHFTRDKVGVVLSLCVNYVGAYLATYRTWDVYHAMKKPNETPNFNMTKKLELDYIRYHRDFKTNIPKLRMAFLKVKNEQDFKTVLEPLFYNLGLNKAC